MPLYRVEVEIDYNDSNVGYVEAEDMISALKVWVNENGTEPLRIEWFHEKGVLRVDPAQIGLPPAEDDLPF